jgi:hypothetical protein
MTTDRSALVAETLTLSELDALERVAKDAELRFGECLISVGHSPKVAEQIATYIQIFEPAQVLRLIAMARVGVEDLGSVAAEPLPVVSPADREPAGGGK